MTHAPDPPALTSRMQPHVKPQAQIQRRFAAWLDEVLANESSPPGLDAAIWAKLDIAPHRERALRQGVEGQQTDLYSMWSAMTTLIQEVKLQGRALAALAGRTARDVPPPSAPGDGLAAVKRLAETLTGERERGLRSEGAQQAQGEVLEALLDVRDSLVRGRQACATLLTDPSAQVVHQRATGTDRPPDHSLRSRLAAAVRSPARRATDLLRGVGRWLGPEPSTDNERRAPLLEAVTALEKGCALSQARLDELLERYEVREIACQRQRFDPRCMTADDVEETDDAPEGRVLEVYRTGYTRAGQVLRSARVKVARSPRRLAQPLKEPKR